MDAVKDGAATPRGEKKHRHPPEMLQERGTGGGERSLIPQGQQLTLQGSPGPLAFEPLHAAEEQVSQVCPES